MPAPGCTCSPGPGPARAEPPHRQTYRHRVDVAHCAAPGRGQGLRTRDRPATAPTSRRPARRSTRGTGPSRCRPAVSGPDRAPWTPATFSISAASAHGQLHHVGRAAAGQHLQRFGDLECVAGRAAQRAVHIGQQDRVGTPCPAPRAIMVSASSRHSDSDFSRAPDPTLRRVPAPRLPRPASCSSPSWRSAAATRPCR